MLIFVSQIFFREAFYQLRHKNPRPCTRIKNLDSLTTEIFCKMRIQEIICSFYHKTNYSQRRIDDTLDIGFFVIQSSIKIFIEYFEDVFFVFFAHLVYVIFHGDDRVLNMCFDVPFFVAQSLH